MSTPTSHQPTSDQIRRFAEALFELDDVVEVRAIWPDRSARKGARSRWVRAGDLHAPELVGRMAKANALGWGIYIGANPRRSVGGRDAASVALARSLFVDFDGGETIDGARLKVRDAGLPEPTVLVASGHGAHCWWRLDDPITDRGEWTLRQKALIARLAGTDQAIHDPPRVMRLPGFTNTKPPPGPCTLIDAAAGRVYALAEFPTAVPETPVAPCPTVNGERRELSKRTLAFIVNGAPEKERNARLFKAAADFVGCGYTVDEAASKLILPAVNSPGNHPFTEDEARATIASAYAKARGPSMPTQGADPVNGGKPEYGPVLVRLCDVQPEPLAWVWPGRIPLGKLSCIAGDPGLGKSLVTLDMAARISTGTPWPDRRDDPQPVGGVVLLSAEDDPADTIVPRLIAAGADLRRITLLKGVKRPGTPGVATFTLDDVGPFVLAIDQTEDCRLVVVDPVSAYYPDGRDSHNNTDVRGLLAPLAELAARRRVAIVFVTHLNKASGGKGVYRMTGSLALPAAARAAWLVMRDQSDKMLRLMLPAKCNLAPDLDGLAYRVGTFGDHPRVEWRDEPVPMTADEALAAETDDPADGSERENARAWLRERLAAGPVPALAVVKDAKSNGIAKRTLERAKGDLGVVCKPHGFGGVWVWALPGAQSPPSAPEVATPGSVANTGETGGLCDPADGVNGPGGGRGGP